MLSAILASVLFTTQVRSTVTLEPVPACQTCDALSVRVATLEAQLASRTAAAVPARRVRLIPMPDPAPVVTYSTPVVTYSDPLGVALPALSAWAPGSYQSTSFVERRGLFGGRFFGGRFAASSFSACGPGGCP